ncbi:UNVERIFIED_CONTAM: hypothetical protein FKN15_002664 [Acipenser sinensis]
MNTRCPPKRVPSSRPLFFTLQTHSEDNAALGQLTGKPAGARPDYRGRWCAPQLDPARISGESAGTHVALAINGLQQPVSQLLRCCRGRCHCLAGAGRRRRILPKRRWVAFRHSQAFREME